MAPTGPFKEVVRDLLIEQGIVDNLGGPNWMMFARDHLGGREQYETLRKAIAGDRYPGVKLMQNVAAALGVDPTEFAEYDLAVAQQQFDPREVGFDAALENLRLWTEANKKKRRR